MQWRKSFLKFFDLHFEECFFLLISLKNSIFFLFFEKYRWKIIFLLEQASAKWKSLLSHNKLVHTLHRWAQDISYFKVLFLDLFLRADFCIKNIFLCLGFFFSCHGLFLFSYFFYLHVVTKRLHFGHELVSGTNREGCLCYKLANGSVSVHVL